MFGVVPFLDRLIGRPLWTPVGLYTAPSVAPPAAQDAARAPAPRLPDWSTPYERPLSRL